MLYIGSLELVHFITGSLYSLTDISPFYLSALATTILVFISMILAFLESTYKW